MLRCVPVFRGTQCLGERHSTTYCREGKCDGRTDEGPTASPEPNASFLVNAHTSPSRGSGRAVCRDELGIRRAGDTRGRVYFTQDKRRS